MSSTETRQKRSDDSNPLECVVNQLLERVADLEAQADGKILLHITIQVKKSDKGYMMYKIFVYTSFHQDFKVVKLNNSKVLWLSKLSYLMLHFFKSILIIRNNFFSIQII